MMDHQWLSQCSSDNLLTPPFDRYIHGLANYVVKRRLQPGEVGFSGYSPEFSTLSMRDENEILAMELVREHTTIPVPKLVYRGSGLVSSFYGTPRGTGFARPADGSFYA